MAQTEPEKMQQRIIGLRIEMARKQRKMSQKQLADAVGIERTSITNIESGRQSPPLYRFLRIAKALKVSPAKLLKGCDP